MYVMVCMGAHRLENYQGYSRAKMSGRSFALCTLCCVIPLILCDGREAMSDEEVGSLDAGRYFLVWRLALCTMINPHSQVHDPYVITPC